MTKTIKGNLIIEKDTTFEEDLIVEGDITGKDGARYNLTVKGSLNCEDLNCWNLNCGDLKAKDVSYYAVCFAYNNIKCKSIKGRRKPCKEPFVLDGTIEVGK